MIFCPSIITRDQFLLSLQLPESFCAYFLLSEIMEGEDEIEDRLQYQLSSLSLSPEKHELLPYFQCRDTTPSLPQEFYSSGGETAFLGQGMLVFSDDVLIPKIEMKSLYTSMACYKLK